MTGYDDLAKIRPTAPGAPDWPRTKQHLLNDILGRRTRDGHSPMRWLAVAAAAAVLIGAVVIGSQTGRGPQVAIPADASASTSPVIPAVPTTGILGADVTLMGNGDAIGICTGGVLTSLPPGCSQEPLPVSGLTWADVGWREDSGSFRWADATVVGRFDGPVFDVQAVFPADDPAAPRPASNLWPDPAAVSVPPDGPTIEDLLRLDARRVEVDGWLSTGLMDRGVIHVTLLVDDPATREAVTQAAGDEFAEWLVFGQPFFWPVKDSGPARPSTPLGGTAPADEPSMIASGVLFDLDGSPALCAGMILESYPPQCGGTLAPLAGLAWEDVPTRRQEGERVWSEMTVLVGEDDGATFHVARAYAADDPSAPSPSGAGVAIPHDFSPLCEEPVVGSGTAAGPEGLAAAASALPGYVGLWISPDQTTLNVAFTDGADEASELLAPTVGATFCAGAVAGITAADAAAATTALGEIIETAGIQGYGHSFDRTGSWLEVSVVRETPEVMSTINEAIGPDAARHLRLSALIQRR